ncbi:MAG: DM13 domain-containing protein, partial [Cyanobacteria bacterium J06659_2]
PLESFDGAQRYAIPETVDVDAFNSVVIWCEEFNVTFGYAAI